MTVRELKVELSRFKDSEILYIVDSNDNGFKIKEVDSPSPGMSPCIYIGESEQF